MQFAKKAIQIFGKNWMSLVLFELTYRVLGFIAFLRISGLLVRICLSGLGYSYLTAENYMEFITYPPTILILGLTLLLLGAATVFEICVVFGCYETSWRKESVYLPAMVASGVRLMIRFLRRYKVRWILYGIAAMPFLGVHFIFWLISQKTVLQFAITQTLSYLPADWLFIILLVLIYLGSMIFTFSLPRRFMTGERPKGITKKLMERLKKSGLRDALIAVGIQIATAAALVLFYLLLTCVMIGAVLLFGSPANQVSNVLFYSSAARYTIGCVMGGAGMLFSLLFIYTYFARSASKRKNYTAYKKSAFSRFLVKRPVIISVTLLLVALEILLLIGETRESTTRLASGKAGVLVTAHRGGARMAPENTISAIEYAVRAKSDVAEIDVQETKDGTIVLLHDTSLSRTTGMKANIWDVTFDEVSKLDAGVKFNSRYRGEKVPTLDEVIKYSKGRIDLNIEVKYNGHNKNIVPKVMQVIEDNNFVDHCVLTSMNYRYLAQAKQINDRIRTGYTLRMTYGDLSTLSAADFFSVKHTYITSGFVSDVHRVGKEIYVWTVNYQGDMQRVINAGVDNVITDDPELVRRVVLGETGRGSGFIDLFVYALKS